MRDVPPGQGSDDRTEHRRGARANGHWVWRPRGRWEFQPKRYLEWSRGLDGVGFRAGPRAAHRRRETRRPLEVSAGRVVTSLTGACPPHRPPAPAPRTPPPPPARPAPPRARPLPLLAQSARARADPNTAGASPPFPQAPPLPAQGACAPPLESRLREAREWERAGGGGE